MVRKKPFFGVFFATIFVTYAILYAVDFYPEPVEEDMVAVDDSSQVEEIEENLVVEPIEVEEQVSPADTSLPVRIIFDMLDKEVPVLNPQSREIPALDEALLSGAVRHPDSADFSEDGNIFILAHSSYLPNVFNKNFQAFNGIQDLTWGDKIRVQSENIEYVYSVKRVYKAKASEVFVPETPGEARLTLATCNSFGSKDERYIVDALLIGSHAL